MAIDGIGGWGGRGGHGQFTFFFLGEGCGSEFEGFGCCVLQLYDCA